MVHNNTDVMVVSDIALLIVMIFNASKNIFIIFSQSNLENRMLINDFHLMHKLVMVNP